MEIAPGIYRLESYLGQKLLAHHLIVGDRSLLVDAGTDALTRERLLPQITHHLGASRSLDMTLITHADVDHFGGLAALRAAYPHCLVLAPAKDRAWIEDAEKIFTERYGAYAEDHHLSYTPETLATLRSYLGDSVPVDLGLTGGEEIRCGAQLTLHVLAVPGHTPGHIMLWEPQRRIAIIGDALNGATQIDRKGNWTAAPPYTDREEYLATIELVGHLRPAVLLTGHYPVMTGQEVTRFIEASREFVVRCDAAVEGILREAARPVTLAQLIDAANPRLGPFLIPPDLEYALEAHLRWAERHRGVHRVRSDNVIAWELVNQRDKG